MFWQMLCAQKTNTQLPLEDSAGKSEDSRGQPKKSEPSGEMGNSEGVRKKPWREYYARNRDRMRSYHRKRYHANKKRHKENVERWKAKNIERVRENNRVKQLARNALRSPEEKRAIARKYREGALRRNPNFDKENHQKSWANPEYRAKVLAACKVYRKKNRKKISKYQSKWLIKKYRTDPHYKLVADLRIRLLSALNGARKQAHTMDLVGCDRVALIKHIESQFKPGMTWNNRARRPGCWVLDHKVPIAAHNMATLEGQKAAFHFTNLQPLWYEENLAKSSWHNGKWWSRKDHAQPACVPTPDPALSTP